MGISLNGLTPAGTYPGLIKTGDNTAISGTPKVLSDGNGNNLPMEVSTTGVNFTNQLQQGGVAVPTASQVAAKQDTLVSGTNIKTINGASLLGPGNIPVVTSPSGVAGAIQFSNGSAFASDAANLFWDDTNNRLGVGTDTPSTALHIVGQTTFSDNALFSADFKYIGRDLNASSIRFSGVSSEVRANISTGGQFQVYNSGTGSGRLTVTSGGQTTISGGGSTSATTSLLVQNSAGTTSLQITDSNLLCLGGTTSSFPAIKRNGTAIDFRLADDSGFTNISANNANLGSATTGSRLSVRGDGTNPIARFENSSGTISFGINSLGETFNFGSGGNVMYVVNQNGSSTINGKALAWYANIDTLAGFCFSFNDNNTQSYTTGTGGMLAIANAIFSPASGSANFRPTSIQYTLNASGGQTGTATGIFLNATETALNGLTHNLMDLQVGGASRFRVSNAGAISIGNTVASAVAVASTHKVTVVIGGTTYYLLATNI